MRGRYLLAGRLGPHIPIVRLKKSEDQRKKEVARCGTRTRNVQIADGLKASDDKSLTLYRLR
jgi:hypothetical protein